MNTHLDHEGPVSRTNAAKMIITQVEKVSFPVFLAGDLNSKPEEEAHSVLNGADSPISDLRDGVPEISRYGHDNTFTGFGYESDREVKRIDFLFVTESKRVEGRDVAWTVEGYGVLENRFENGVYASDHRAVLGDVLLYSW